MTESARDAAILILKLTGVAPRGADERMKCYAQFRIIKKSYDAYNSEAVSAVQRLIDLSFVERERHVAFDEHDNVVNVEAVQSLLREERKKWAEVYEILSQSSQPPVPSDSPCSRLLQHSMVRAGYRSVRLPNQHRRGASIPNFGDRENLRSKPTWTQVARTERGVEMLRTHVGVLSFKEEEYEALLDKLKPTDVFKGRRRSYDIAEIETPNGICRVALTRAAQGNLHAQAAATELLGDLSPTYMLVVGIAGGIPTPDFCLGDVVVSDYIQDLTQEDTGTSPEARRFNALGGPLHPEATRIVERIRSIERTMSRWNDPASVGVERPTYRGEHSTSDEIWNSEIDDALARHSKRSDPKATARKIASSDRLIKDPDLLRGWRAVLKAVSAAEMESAGVYIQCQREGIPVLAIRGISDIVGWKRDEAWTLYACHTAAAFTKMLVESGVFTGPDTAPSDSLTVKVDQNSAVPRVGDRGTTAALPTARRDLGAFRERLVSFLCLAFISENLKELAYYNPALEPLMTSVNWYEPLGTVAKAFVEELERRDLLDHDFFQMLKQQRPQRADEIDEISCILNRARVPQQHSTDSAAARLE